MEGPGNLMKIHLADTERLVPFMMSLKAERGDKLRLDHRYATWQTSGSKITPLQRNASRLRR